ncbi:MAG: hypothetical protein LBL58_11150 [Tannerellaceae bacterium]|nr:hypothetical protein [Tannerellaceae bacterium]
MKILKYILLFALPLIFSCQDEMGEPDKTIENVTGTLRYYNEADIWAIHYYYPGTIDSADLYLIKDTNNDFSFEEGKKVTVSGSCYLLEEESFSVPVGTTVYYIIITDLTYE